MSFWKRLFGGKSPETPPATKRQTEQPRAANTQPIPSPAARPARDQSSSPEDEAERLFQSGRQLFAQNKFQQAVLPLERAAELHPTSPEIHFTLGMTYGRVAAECAYDGEKSLSWANKSRMSFQSALKHSSVHGGLNAKQIAVARESITEYEKLLGLDLRGEAISRAEDYTSADPHTLAEVMSTRSLRASRRTQFPMTDESNNSSREARHDEAIAAGSAPQPEADIGDTHLLKQGYTEIRVFGMPLLYAARVSFPQPAVCSACGVELQLQSASLTERFVLSQPVGISGTASLTVKAHLCAACAKTNRPVGAFIQIAVAHQVGELNAFKGGDVIIQIGNQKVAAQWSAAITAFCTASRIFKDSNEKLRFLSAPDFNECRLLPGCADWRDPMSGQGKFGAGQCFIATACYGQPDAPEVLVFRGFRDKVLLPSSCGRWFVSCYYRCSPRIATYLDTHPYAASFVRETMLGPLLRILRARTLR